MTLNLGRTATLLTVLTLSAPALAGDVPWKEDEAPARWTPWATPTAQVQTWFTAWDQDEDKQADPGGYGDPEHDTGFTLARARVGLKGGFKWVDFSMRVGLGAPYDTLTTTPPQIQLVDAWARASFDTAGGTTRISVGAQDVPFGRESQMSSNDLVFQDRSVASSWMTPVRDLGALATHEYKWIVAKVGVYNGAGNGSVNTGLYGNADDGVAVVARLEGRVGGDTYRTNSTSRAFGVGGSVLYNTTAAQTSLKAEGDLLGRIAGVSLLGEFFYEKIEPKDDPIVAPGVPVDTVRMGATGQLSYYGELPIGAIEPAVRFSYYNDATHLKDNGDVGILHGGVTWREPIPFVDIGAGYIHRFELQGQDLKNDTVRVWVGLKYPSRRFSPVNVVDVFRRMGEKPLSGPGGDEDAPTGGGGGKRKK